MQYDPFSVSDRLEKATILTNGFIVGAMLDEMGDEIRAMSHADFKQMWKDLFSIYYYDLVE